MLGLEVDLQGLTGNSVSGVGIGLTQNPSMITALTASKSLDYFGTIRGRVGYLLTPTLLGYVTGGAAYGQIGMASSVASFAPDLHTTTVGGDSLSGVRVGWTAGAGLEWSLDPKWSVKAEISITTSAPDGAVRSRDLRRRPIKRGPRQQRRADDEGFDPLRRPTRPARRQLSFHLGHRRGRYDEGRRAGARRKG